MLVVNGGERMVPYEEYEALHKTLEEMTDELSALRTQSASFARQVTRLKRELDDAYEQADDTEAIKKILVYWRDKTGRDKRTKIRMDGERAKRVRWARRKWKDREICLMVVGCMSGENSWWRDHDKTDIAEHILGSEDRAEQFLKAGLAAIGETE